MKIALKIFSIAIAATLFFSSCTDKCSNGVQNSNETEIDCGGDCEPCPPEATLSATILGNVYTAESAIGSDNGNGIYISTNGTGGSDHTLSFSGITVNGYSPITDCDFTNPGSNTYINFQFGDTGSVYITSHDELRKIVSGRYWCRMTDGGVATINDGLFENVRYN